MKMCKLILAGALCALCATAFLVSGGSAQQGAAGAGRANAAPPTKAQVIEDLVYGNRILYNEGVLDAFGHISVRDPQNPSRFYMSRGLAPSQVTTKDILEYDLDCKALGVPNPNTGYGERFIHCGIYRARPDVRSVIHAHSPGLVPFGLTKGSLRPVFLMGGFLGTDPVPIFDIRDVAPDTNMMVTNNDFGNALAKALGNRPVVLMRGHGETVVGGSVQEAVVHAYYAEVNAKLQTEAARMGTITFLSPGEAANAARSVSIQRPWEMFKARVGKIE